MKTFSNKTVLITGASSGIGLAFANNLAARGANLVLSARSKDKLKSLAQDLEKSHGITATVCAIDLEKPGSAEKLYQDVKAKGLSVDVLVNNAGFGKWGDFLDFSVADYRAMLNLNVVTLTELCHLFLPSMLEKKTGGIINIASMAAFLPVPYAAVYSASKSYVLMFSEALHGECAGTGVSVLGFCPGGTETNFASVASPHKIKSAGLETPETVAEKGIKAFLKGKASVISGAGNQIAGIIPRILPREHVIRLSGKLWQKVLSQRV